MTNRILFRNRFTLLICATAGATLLAQRAPQSIEIAFVANAEGASVAMVDVAARSIIGTIAVNFAEVESEGPGAPNYAQDTDVSPDGQTLYVSRGYLGDVAAFDIASGRPLWTRPLNTMRADRGAVARWTRTVRLGVCRQSGLQDCHRYRRDHGALYQRHLPS
jgi:hypothetical protein